MGGERGRFKEGIITVGRGGDEGLETLKLGWVSGMLEEEEDKGVREDIMGQVTFRAMGVEG